MMVSCAQIGIGVLLKKLHVSVTIVITKTMFDWNKFEAHDNHSTIKDPFGDVPDAAVQQELEENADLLAKLFDSEALNESIGPDN
jgi:hypothetical protein